MATRLYGWRDLLPTADDLGLAGAAGGGTTVLRLLGGAKLGASILAGVESFGIGIAVIPIYKGIRNTIHNGLTGDEIVNRRWQRFKDCKDKYGPY